MSLLKYHYPHRFAGMFILNTNGIFQLIWNILKPFVPKKALGKVHVLGKIGNSKGYLDDHVGISNLDSRLGGSLKIPMNTTNDFDSYLANGYWPSA